MENNSVNIRIANAKQEYINCFNSLSEKYDLPASIWYLILKDVLNEINEIQNKDLTRDLQLANESKANPEDEEIIETEIEETNGKN